MIALRAGSIWEMELQNAPIGWASRHGGLALLTAAAAVNFCDVSLPPGFSAEKINAGVAVE